MPEKPPTVALKNLWQWGRGYISRFSWVIAPVWLAAKDVPGAEDEGIIGCCCPDGEACTRWGRHLVSGLGVAHDEHEIEKILPTSNPHVLAGHVGLGMLTGSESRTFVLDVGVAGKMTRARFKATGHILTQLTPSGGEHWLFRLSEDEAVYGSRKEIELVTGCYVLGDGGFVVLGPRPGYSWAGGSSVLTERGITEPPESLRLALGREKLIKPRGDIHRDDAWRTSPGTPLTGVTPRSYSRLGDIRRVVDANGHLTTWTPGIGWRVWTSLGWGDSTASEREIKSFITDLPEMHRREADDLKRRGDDAMAKQALKYSSLSANYATSRVMADLESDNRILVPSARDWDSEGWICGLPVIGGVGRLLNLRTGEIERDQITRRVSRQLGADYHEGPGGALAHLWTRGVDGHGGKYFVKYITDLHHIYGADWVRLLQRAAGASLFGRQGVTGDTDAVFVLKGASRSGKSTFVEMMLAVAGDYAKTANSVLLFGDRPSEFADAAIMGYRVLAVAEPPMNAPLNVPRLKALSGGDSVTGRLPYGRSEVSFTPEVSVWLSTNHALEFSDDALWRRLRFFEFTRSWDAATGELPELRKALTQDPEELRLALAWMLQGARDWVEEGWGGTGVWDSARDDEKAKHSVVDKWADDALVVTGSPLDGFSHAELLSSFTTWTTMTGEKPPAGMSRPALRDELEQTCLKRGLIYDKRAKQITGGRLDGAGVSI